MNRRNFLTRVFAGAVATPALLRIIEGSVPKLTTFPVIPPMDYPPNRAPIYWRHGAQNITFHEAVQIMDECEKNKRAKRPNWRVKPDNGTPW